MNPEGSRHGQRCFIGDWVAGGMFVAFSLRIPLGGFLDPAKYIAVLWLGVFAPLLVLTIPLILSLRVGAWIQLCLQLVILLGPIILPGPARPGVASIIALILMVYSGARLAGVYGPPMRRIRAR